MAPIKNTAIPRRRSSFSLLSTRRRSLAQPKNFTFAPNVTPISYPSDPASPRSSPNPGSDEPSPLTPAPAVPSRPRRRGGRKASVDHIPRPPNAFMLFRQNFVHQRHIPGSIETNHNSLSRIVGNCWKALPDPERKVWEALADEKKDEHKRLYPDYRFQPKHDPEKKRKRQAARAAAGKAERERRWEHEFRSAEPEHGLRQPEPRLEAEERERAMAARRQQVRTAHNHLGHRRSSSVPLPTETYGYTYNPYGNAYGQAPHADPFNFANPALAQVPPSSSSSGANGGIALPTLPSNLSGLVGSWYVPRANVNSSEAGSPAPDANEQEGQAQLMLPPQLQAPQQSQVPMTLSRAASPRLPYTGMSGMNSGMNTMGMGSRAARQHQLGQLGRRASSTQPVLQHQLASGAFSDYPFGGTSSFPHPPFPPHDGSPFNFNFNDRQHHQQEDQHQFGGFDDGFVGAVAEGFTNPFAPASSGGTSSLEGASSSAPDSAPSSTTSIYPAPLAPHAMWYEIDSVDPITPIGGAAPSPTSASFAIRQQHPAPAPTLPEVDTALLNPAFSFGCLNEAANVEAEAPLSPTPGAVDSAFATQQSAVDANSGYRAVYGVPPAQAMTMTSSSAPGMGTRDSFDFSAFNSFLAGLSQNQQRQHTNADVSNPNGAATYADVYALFGVPPHVLPGPAPAEQDAGCMLAQPVPLRKVVPPSLPAAPEHEHEDSGHVHAYYAPEPEHMYEASQPSTSTGSSASASPSSALAEVPAYAPVPAVPHAVVEDMVSGHELLACSVDVALERERSHSAPNSNSSRAEAHNERASHFASDVRGYAYGLGMELGHAQYGPPPHGQGMGMGGGYGLSSALALADPLGAGVPPLHGSLGACGMDDYGGYARSSEQCGGPAVHGNADGEDDDDEDQRFSFSAYVHGSPFLSAAVVN